MVSRFLIAKVSSELRLNPGLGTHKKCPFLVNRGVPSVEVTNTKIHVNIFRRPYFVSPERKCLLNRKVLKENGAPLYMGKKKKRFGPAKVCEVHP